MCVPLKIHIYFPFLERKRATVAESESRERPKDLDKRRHSVGTPELALVSTKPNRQRIPRFHFETGPFCGPVVVASGVALSPRLARLFFSKREEKTQPATSHGLATVWFGLLCLRIAYTIQTSSNTTQDLIVHNERLELLEKKAHAWFFFPHEPVITYVCSLSCFQRNASGIWLNFARVSPRRPLQQTTSSPNAFN
jgi:hypothetical protein